ncbi:MAG: GntR family transcriptional regulator [Actinomycetales bacterium]
MPAQRRAGGVDIAVARLYPSRPAPDEGAMERSVLSGVSKLTLREQVLASLREAILTGRLAPGTHLGEVELSEQLGVSRGTVREALRALQQGGLVDGAERGLKVRRLTSDEVAELYQVRAQLEVLAVSLLMQAPDKPERLDRLEAALPPERNTHLAYEVCLDLDMTFHRTMMELAGNQILAEVWGRLEDLMRIVVVSDVSRYPKPVMTREHHVPIVEAMRGEDESAATATLRAHMAASSQVWEDAGRKA